MFFIIIEINHLVEVQKSCGGTFAHMSLHKHLVVSMSSCIPNLLKTHLEQGSKNMPLGLRPCGPKIKPVMNGSHCFKLAREIQQDKYNQKRWYRTILGTPEQDHGSLKKKKKNERTRIMEI